MHTICACGVHSVDVENATYVKDGVPMCHESTCAKVKEHRTLRRVPYFDHGAFDVVGEWRGNPEERM